MRFDSVQFFVFFLSVVCVLFFMHKKARLVWLLVCNYYFYMCWNAKSALLLAFITLCTYIAGRVLETAEDEKRKKRIVAVCCVASFSFLSLFKYFNFLVDSINGLSGMVGNGKIIGLRMDFLLPIGISFYTFQAVGYVIDVYRGEKAEHNLIKYAVFVSFFPQLGSGPIERGRNILGQLRELETKKLWDYDRIKNGILLMLWGLFQKIILADRLALRRQMIPASYLLRQILLDPDLSALQYLADCLCHHLPGQPGGQRIDRLHHMKQPVVFSQCIVFRLFHLVPVPFLTDNSTEHVLPASLKITSQKRHVKPDALHLFLSHADLRCEHLVSGGPLYRRYRQDHSLNRLFPSVLQLRRFHQLFIRLVITGIMLQQVPDGMDPCLCKQNRCLFPDSFQYCDRIFRLHGPFYSTEIT